MKSSVQHVRVITAKGRRLSSTLWLQRQLNDPYVQEARRRGYASRAAFKLLALHDKYRLFRPGMKILDLGSAPGGWAQVSRECVGQKGHVYALDKLPFSLDGVTCLQGDMTSFEVQKKLQERLVAIDGLLSDMAPPLTGHASTDAVRVDGLAQESALLALQLLKKGGFCVLKVLASGGSRDLLGHLKPHFRTLDHVKPPASRQRSSEMYVVARDFKGLLKPNQTPENRSS